MTASRRKFTQEFKNELCREVIGTSKPVKDVAQAYGQFFMAADRVLWPSNHAYSGSQRKPTR